MPDKNLRNSLPPGYKLHWYEIEKILGKGAFGITYLARDTNLNQSVAIKEHLPIELAVRADDSSVHPLSESYREQYSQGLERFIREARILAKFDHPNIVRVLAVFEQNGTAYMVMRYEQGESFRAVLKRRKTMDEADLLGILMPILEGLEQIHDAGFLHRDVKPPNIFIRDDNSPVLLDFGSAREAIGENTRTLTSLVSPGYAPFEQYYSKSDQQGPWTDIYGLGATLYRAASGRQPMDAVDRSKAIIKHQPDVLTPITEIGAGRYSLRFLKAIDHALQFKEEDRPQSITQWRAEFLAGEEEMGTVAAPPVEQLTQLAPPLAALDKPIEPAPGLGPWLSSPRWLVLSSAVVGFFALGLGWRYQYAVSVEPEAVPRTETRVSAPGPAPERSLAPPDPNGSAPGSGVGPGPAPPPALAWPEPGPASAQADENRVKDLLTEARTAVDHQRLTAPAGENALEKLQAVLALDPGNAAAQQVKLAMAERFLSLAREAHAKGEIRDALAYLDKAKQVLPNGANAGSVRLHSRPAEEKAAPGEARQRRKR